MTDLAQTVLASGSRSLDERSRTDLGSLLGHDFNRVKVHADVEAARAADALGASAFSVRDHIVFGVGRYAPETQPGRDLIAHELTHVAQSSIASGSAAAIRRNERSGPPTPATVPAAAVVPDGAVLAVGQMHKSEFLDRLEAELIVACDLELAPFGRSAKDCPTILKTIQRHRGLSINAALRLIQAFAHPAPRSNANELITAIISRAREVARRVAERTAQEQGQLQPSADPAAASHPVREANVIQSQLKAGHPLDRDIRGSMEVSFQTGFADVRVHTDESASSLNRALGARAFTVGTDIAFAAGEYRPGTTNGDQLIAHELAHTIQQRSGGGPAGAAAREDDERYERQAAEAARMVTGFDHVGHSHLGAVGQRVQRWPVVLAGAIATAELAPEAIVAGEIGADVVVVDGALTATAVTATPAVLETAAPVVAETLAPAALESTVPLAETVATTSATTTSATAITTTALATGAALTISSDSPEDEQQQRCRSEPSPDPLPISWPAELPDPEPTSRPLQRTPSADLEWLGIGRGEEQSNLARQIREARESLVPPPSPCFPEDADPNAPYDAHHRHPLYLGGEDAAWNLCALRADRHQAGHPRLDNQSEYLEEYIRHGICSPFLRLHPAYQQYVVVATK